MGKWVGCGGVVVVVVVVSGVVHTQLWPHFKMSWQARRLFFCCSIPSQVQAHNQVQAINSYTCLSYLGLRGLCRRARWALSGSAAWVAGRGSSDRHLSIAAPSHHTQCWAGVFPPRQARSTTKIYGAPFALHFCLDAIAWSWAMAFGELIWLLAFALGCVLAFAAPRCVRVCPHLRPRRFSSGSASAVEVAARKRKFRNFAYSACSQPA